MWQETMVYVGLDVHKEICQACVINDSGRVLSNEKFSSAQKDLDRFLARFNRVKFVLESTGIWELIYEGIERRGFDVVLAHPLKVRSIAEAKVKTDKVDAETLAQLLRTDLIPRSWVPPKDMRDLRQLVRQRAYLVQRATGFKNRIHAELLRRGVRRPEEMKRFTKKSIDWMRSLGIPTVESCLNCLENIQEQIEYINTQLLDEHNRRPDAQLIATVPGIGFYGALLIHAEIDDIHRFPSPENLCAYAGLVPTVSQSASSVRYEGSARRARAISAGSSQRRSTSTPRTSHHRASRGSTPKSRGGGASTRRQSRPRGSSSTSSTGCS
ncbi:MAG: IS110 family transposase [Thermoplasmata archaeon]